MFTGIIQSLGTIERIDKSNNIFTIKTSLDFSKSSIGTSICCDGVCLTAISIIKEDSNFLFSVNVGEETIKRTNLYKWKKNYKINIEKSLKLGDEISGHFVYGHVDAVIKVISIDKLNNSWEYGFSFSTLSNSLDFKNFVVEKGSVAINGISLTVSNVSENSFKVSIIPHTYENTNISFLKYKDKVNIEFDPIARYISKK